jgi:hypothetical protein
MIGRRQGYLGRWLQSRITSGCPRFGTRQPTDWSARTAVCLNLRVILRLIPKVFHNTLNEGLDLFVHCLGFRVLYRDENLAVVERDGAKAYVVESPEYASKDRPEIALETDTIQQLYEEIKARRPEMLHPNLSEIRRQPWVR